VSRRSLRRLRLPRGERFGVTRTVVLIGLVSLLPLALLAYASSRLASDAVREETESRMVATATITSRLMAEELSGLAALVDSYANRPTLVAALGGDTREIGGATRIRYHLDELVNARPGIYTTFVARPDGTLIDIVPATPSIRGKNFSFRDWYRGVLATGGPYVSEAYETQAAGTPLVVAAAAPIRERRVAGQRGKLVGILVAGVSLDHIQGFTEDLAGAQDVKLKITDQRGFLVASSDATPTRLIDRRGDPRVAAALRGRSGVGVFDTTDGRRLSAYAPAPAIGWTVTASVPANAAFAAVSDLRSTVLLIASLVALVLCGGLILLHRALHARREADDEARRQATITQAVLDATVDGLRLVDPEGNTLVANTAMDAMGRDLLKLPSHGPISERILALADRTTDPEGYRAATTAVFADPDHEGRYDYEFADTGRCVHRYTRPVRDTEGGLIGRLFVLREVTAEREAERLKSDLVATVSHELRTPLASILGFAELLVERDPPPETRARYLQTIHGEARRLTTLINDFLDLQRMEEARFNLSIATFDLGELLREQVETYAGQSREHTIELHHSEEPLRVAGDRDRIAQVVANLLSNAIKYSPAGGRVEVAVRQEDRFATVSVKDDGIGIPRDQQGRIFEKFFRVDSSDTREIGGTGLGLALAREIVQAHGGELSFESAVGRGSKFSFTLPVGRQREGRLTSGPYVLVVEDDAVAASLMAEYLAEEGYDVETAATAEAALEIVAEEPPALVCLDMTLGGELDGWQMLARLKEDPATADVPVVVCTAGNGRKQAAALGAANFLTKPFSAARLRAALRGLIPYEGGRVLVVEDEEPVRRLVVETLATEELHVEEAADGEEALAAVGMRPPDAIVLDLMLPKLDGFSVLERLQAHEETRRIPVVVLTAKQLSAEERVLLRAHAVSLLEKNAYTARDLRELIRQALGRMSAPV
jgi:signal transduction histidine kinase/CheY-like chemotaxis protein